MSRRVSPDRINLKGVYRMAEWKSIVNYQTAEYGAIRVKLAEVMDRQGITRNKLRTLTGTKYDVVNRYYKADCVEMVDLDFFAKVCFVLDCQIEDLLEYEKPVIDRE